MRVVVVDDNEDFRMLLAISLRLRGVEVVAEAIDGLSGIRAVAHHQPDGVVLDVQMPGMGGLEALPQVRLACPEARVVLYTASPIDTIDLRSASTDGVDLLSKSSGIDPLVIALGSANVSQTDRAT